MFFLWLPLNQLYYLNVFDSGRTGLTGSTSGSTHWLKFQAVDVNVRISVSNVIFNGLKLNKHKLKLFFGHFEITQAKNKFKPVFSKTRVKAIENFAH